MDHNIGKHHESRIQGRNRKIGTERGGVDGEGGVGEIEGGISPSKEQIAPGRRRTRRVKKRTRGDKKGKEIRQVRKETTVNHRGL